MTSSIHVVRCGQTIQPCQCRPSKCFAWTKWHERLWSLDILEMSFVFCELQRHESLDTMCLHNIKVENITCCTWYTRNWSCSTIASNLHCKLLQLKHHLIIANFEWTCMLHCKHISYIYNTRQNETISACDHLQWMFCKQQTHVVSRHSVCLNKTMTIMNIVITKYKYKSSHHICIVCI